MSDQARAVAGPLPVNRFKLNVWKSYTCIRVNHLAYLVEESQNVVLSGLAGDEVVDIGDDIHTDLASDRAGPTGGEQCGQTQECQCRLHT